MKIFKSIKTWVALLAVVAVPVSLAVVASPAYASGANCTFSTGAISYNGSWVWNAYATGCTLVNAVQFHNTTSDVYVLDHSTGISHFAASGGGVAGNVNGPAILGGQTTYTNSIWGPGCPNAFSVNKHWTVRIHNESSNTWGSYVPVVSANENIC